MITRGLPLVVLALLVGAVGGCGKKPSGDAKAGSGEGAGKDAKNEAEEESLNVAVTTGTADRRDVKTNAKLYTVHWKTSALAFNRNGIEEGKMNDVSGTVYEAEKGVERPKSTFTAETGYAKKATQTLFLEGRVVVKSPTYGATLRAKKLEWLPDVKRYKATGDVTVNGTWGHIGPADELLASSDLKTVGTPEAFKRQTFDNP